MRAKSPICDKARPAQTEAALTAHGPGLEAFHVHVVVMRDEAFMTTSAQQSAPSDPVGDLGLTTWKRS